MPLRRPVERSVGRCQYLMTPAGNSCTSQPAPPAGLRPHFEERPIALKQLAFGNVIRISKRPLFRCHSQQFYERDDVAFVPVIGTGLRRLREHHAQFRIGPPNGTAGPPPSADHDVKTVRNSVRCRQAQSNALCRKIERSAVELGRIIAQDNVRSLQNALTKMRSPFSGCIHDALPDKNCRQLSLNTRKKPADPLTRARKGATSLKGIVSRAASQHPRARSGKTCRHLPRGPPFQIIRIYASTS